MLDTPEEKARKRKILQELVRLSEEAGLYDDESTPDEIVASIKQIRKEMAEERKMSEGNDKINSTRKESNV
jgi:uncharacterized coiled-coil DUF342 family protein